jgi:hypothetical protein
MEKRKSKRDVNKMVIVGPLCGVYVHTLVGFTFTGFG